MRARLKTHLLCSLFAMALLLSLHGPALSNPFVAKEPEPDYVIGTQDVIEVSVWKNADLSKTVTVRPDGMITLPLIGEVKASGKTPGQLKDDIIDRLKSYQQTAIATVIVQEVNSNRIYVLGEVVSPGTYVLSRRTTILQALAMAGGFSQFASKKIVLVRERPEQSAPEEKHTIRFSDIINSNSDKDQNFMLRPGDTIFVP